MIQHVIELDVSKVKKTSVDFLAKPAQWTEFVAEMPWFTGENNQFLSA
jgi:FixJ family two-component response regulator